MSNFVAKGRSYDSRPFTPAPDGPSEAVLVDVVDKGIEKRTFTDNGKQTEKEVRYIALVWEIDAHMENGRRFTISKRYPFSLAKWIPKGKTAYQVTKLRADVEKIIGRALTEEETRDGFDVESLIGRPNLLMVEHNPDQSDPNKIWTNVGSISKSRSPIAPSGEYTRQIDRDRQKLNPAPSSGFTGQAQRGPIGANTAKHPSGAQTIPSVADEPDVAF